MRIDTVINELERAKIVPPSGHEYWMGRDLMSILDYASWEKFEAVIERAVEACKSLDESVDNHFRRTVKKIEAAKGAMVPRADY
jgi:DNA-damage-inducible protein D